MKVKSLVKWVVVVVWTVLLIQEAAFAGQGVTVSVTTDKDAYTISSLSTTPMVISLYVENNTDEWLVLTEDYRKLNSYAHFGNIRVYLELKPGELFTGTFPETVKGLAFKPVPWSLGAYQNVVTETKLTYVTKQVGTSSVQLLGTFIGPHARKMVARAEVSLRDFTMTLPPENYIVRASIYPRSIWNWITQAEAASQSSDGYEAVTFIKLK